MNAMAGIGLAVSLALWAAAAVWHLAAMKAVIRGLPAEWREHEEAGPAYSEALGYGVRDLLPATRRTLPWVGGLAVYLLALAAIGVSEAVLVAAAVLGGLAWAQSTRSAERRRARELADREGLDYPRRPHGLRLTYTGTLYALCVAITLTGCFAGLVVRDLIG
jgi:hypothetical protein